MNKKQAVLKLTIKFFFLKDIVAIVIKEYKNILK